MPNLLYLILGLIALTSSSDGLINTNNPVDVIRQLAEGIENQRTLINAFPEIALSQKDQLTELFKGKLLGEPQQYGMNFSACAMSMKDFIFDIVKGKSYALRMLDSWGKLDSGIATGNVKWYGRYYECLDVHTANFSGQYFIIVIGATDKAAFGIGPETSFSVGICLPSTCSQQQASELVDPIGKVIKKNVYAYQPIQTTEYTAVDIVALLVCSLLGCILLIATCYELYLTTWRSKHYGGLSVDYTEIDTMENVEPSVWCQLLLSFSVIKNTRTLFDTRQKDGNINVLHGLRFISMTWVMLGHTFIFGAGYVDNVVDGAKYYVSQWQFQAVGNATFSVDSFFFLSGLLATYLGMREMKKRNGRLSVGLPYLYRYLRLTPAYAFCLLISMSLYNKMGDGPMWPNTAQAFKTPCEKYWWTNLLYINNLHPSAMGDECFGWGWYLANDTQFFLLCPFILWAFYKSPLIGGIILSSGTLSSIIVTGALSSHYLEQPQAVGIGSIFYSVVHPKSKANETSPDLGYFLEANITTPSPPLPGPSASDTFWSDIYQKPWCRIGAYFIGMATGYILYRTRLRIRMGKIPALAGWTVTSATGLAIIYGLYGHIGKGTQLNVGVAAFYNAISRPLWTACLGWVVLACSSGYGGPVNSFLSWKVFIPLSRLTYCAYLVHPLVIFWAYGIMEDLLHFSIVEITIRFLGMVALSYAIAYVVSVLIEMPMLGVIKASLGKTMGKTKSSIVPEVQRSHVNLCDGEQSKA